MKGKFITTQIRIVCLGNRRAPVSETKTDKRRTSETAGPLPLVAVRHNSHTGIHDHFQAA